MHKPLTHNPLQGQDPHRQGFRLITIITTMPLMRPIVGALSLSPSIPPFVSLPLSLSLSLALSLRSSGNVRTSMVHADIVPNW